MTSFQVDPESLDKMAVTLSQLGPVMDHMKTLSAQETGALGGSEIESSVSSFSSTWHYGAGQLEKHVSSVAQNCGKAAQNYATTENNICTAATKVK